MSSSLASFCQDELDREGQFFSPECQQFALTTNPPNFPDPHQIATPNDFAFPATPSSFNGGGGGGLTPSGTTTISQDPSSFTHLNDANQNPISKSLVFGLAFGVAGIIALSAVAVLLYVRRRRRQLDAAKAAAPPAQAAPSVDREVIHEVSMSDVPEVLGMFQVTNQGHLEPGRHHGEAAARPTGPWPRGRGLSAVDEGLGVKGEKEIFGEV